MNNNQEIRSELKKLNITNKQVSVTGDRGSISIRIKDISVDEKAVSQIAKKFEKISYCEVSQEILSGGNTYVSIQLDWKYESALKKTEEFLALKAEVEKALATIEGNAGVEIRPGFVVFKSYNLNGFQVSADYSDDVWMTFHNAEYVTFELFKAIKQNKI